MKDRAAKAVSLIFGVAPTALTRIGGGAYGVVFRAELPEKPRAVAVKAFIREGDCAREALWYAALQNAKVRLPRLFGCANGCLALEYVAGVNASAPPAHCDFDGIGEQIARDIALLHSCRGSGFGAISGAADLRGGGCPTWRGCFKTIAGAQFAKAENAARAGLFSAAVPDLLTRIFCRFDLIFNEPPYPSLIHGDLNAENIMIDARSYLCMIDPINSLWGDPELELFQLTQNGGDRFRLLENYAALRPLTPDYRLKSACYAALAEADWFADIRRPQDALLNSFLSALQDRLNEYGY